MKLELTVRPDHLSVTILNNSSKDLRLWEFDNSWGWWSLSVEVKGEADEKIRNIKHKSREWTKNGPVYFVLAPGESRRVDLKINDGWWDLPEEMPELNDRPVLVRARYEVQATPQSLEHDVFVGSEESNWGASKPPHGWLSPAGK